MLSYALRRIAGFVPTLLVVVTASFFVMRLAPGGPFDQEQALPPAVRANLERLYGLDEPLTLQYAHYLRALVHGDVGASLRERDLTGGDLLPQGLLERGPEVPVPGRAPVVREIGRAHG